MKQADVHAGTEYLIHERLSAVRPIGRPAIGASPGHGFPGATVCHRVKVIDVLYGVALIERTHQKCHRDPGDPWKVTWEEVTSTELVMVRNLIEPVERAAVSA